MPLSKEAKQQLLEKIKDETAKDIEALGPGASDALTSIYAIEGRDPFSIKRWLMQEGIQEDIVDQVILRFARKLLARQKFGCDQDGISVLSRTMRDRARKMQQSRDKKKWQLSLKKEIFEVPWYVKIWRKLCP